MLVKHRASLEIRDNEGHTPLSFAHASRNYNIFNESGY